MVLLHRDLPLAIGIQKNLKVGVLGNEQRILGLLDFVSVWWRSYDDEDTVTWF